MAAEKAENHTCGTDKKKRLTADKKDKNPHFSPEFICYQILFGKTRLSATLLGHAVENVDQNLVGQAVKVGLASAFDRRMADKNDKNEKSSSYARFFDTQLRADKKDRNRRQMAE